MPKEIAKISDFIPIWIHNSHNDYHLPSSIYQMANVPTLYGIENSFLFSFSHSQNYKVLKPRPDHTVRPEKPQTAHLCIFFNLKNPSMEKSGDPCEPLSNLKILRTMINFSRFPTSLWIWTLKKSYKKKKKTHTHTHTQKQALNYAPFRVGVDGGEGRLLEQTVFVEEIKGTRDSDGGRRTLAAKACVWVSWLVELTELPFFPPKKWWSKRTRSEVTAHYGLCSSQRSSTVD